MPSSAACIAATRKRKRLSLNHGRSAHCPWKKWKVTTHSVGRKSIDDEKLDLLRRLDDRSMYSIIGNICRYLDYDSLKNAEKVSPEWRVILSDDLIWKRLLERNVASDRMWRKLILHVQHDGDKKLLHSSKRMCDSVAYWQRQIMNVMISSVSLLTTSVKLISRVLDVLKLFGLDEDVLSPMEDSESDDF